MNAPAAVLSPDNQIYLCLSGGGLRATFFHLGVIRSLRKNDLLKSVKAVCAVSGGSITAAHLVASWDDFLGTNDKFEAACKKLLDLGQRDIRGRIVRRWLLSFRWIGYGRVKSLAREYARFFDNRKILDLYRDKTGSPLDPARPSLHLLCTSFTTGHLCSFSEAGFSTLFDDGVRDVPADVIDLGLAIAASSAFPPLFPPVRLTREDVGGDPLTFPVPAIYLTDGGVYDNLGVERCITLINKEDEQASIVLSDAGGSFNWDEQSGFSSLISRTVRTTDILMRNAAIESTRLLAENQSVRLVHISIGSVTKASPLPQQVQSFIKQIRTDLDHFSTAEAAVIATHGEAIADSRFQDGKAQAFKLPLILNDVSTEDLLSVVKKARLRRLGLFNFRDYISYVILCIPIMILLSAGYIFWHAASTINDQTDTIVYLQDAKDAVNRDLAKVESNNLPPTANLKDYTIFIQFAGFRRDLIAAMATDLVTKGWTVPAAEKGGQRTASANGLNEIRIGREEDRTKAQVLADSIQQSGLVKQKPQIKIVAKIPARTIEIWISS